MSHFEFAFNFYESEFSVKAAYFALEIICFTRFKARNNSLFSEQNRMIQRYFSEANRKWTRMTGRLFSGKTKSRQMTEKFF